MLQVMEAGAGTLAALHASSGHSAQFCVTSSAARDLSTACALHAYAFSTMVDCMGSNAACVPRRDDATLRAVLLPLLQLAAAAAPLVAGRAAAAVTSLCTCALLRLLPLCCKCTCHLCVYACVADSC